jgi:hypothetical protein
VTLNCRWEKNIKVRLIKIDFEGVNWVTVTRYSGGSCENGNEHLASTEENKLTDYLSDYKFLKKDSACDFKPTYRISSKAEVQNLNSPSRSP